MGQARDIVGIVQEGLLVLLRITDSSMYTIVIGW